MILRTVFFTGLVAVSLFSCLSRSKQLKSRVAYFNYGGYGDTLYASLGGQVFELNRSIKTKDSLTPLKNVEIKVEENNQSVFTDSAGSFVLLFEKGTFNLLIRKENYQSLRLTNYISDPDQFSGTIIYLEKEKGLETFNIPANKK